MEQSGANLAKGILTGCFIAAISMSLSSKASAEEIIRPPVEKDWKSNFQRITPGIYIGPRGSKEMSIVLWI
jgi:hypothetical protein